MANIERLTKRVKLIEEWMDENEGGPTLDNMNYLIMSLRNTTEYAQNMERQHQGLRSLHGEFFAEKEMHEEWNTWLKEKENAVQKQQTEEDAVQEEAESGKEAIEAPVKETKD